MKNTSASALTWFAAILLFIGLLLMSPSGSFFVYIMAALFVVAPALLGTKNIRIAAIILLLASIFLVVFTYPKFKNENILFMNRGHINSLKEH